MELIPILEAARRKGVSKSDVSDAIEAGTIDCQKVGERSMVVKANRKFEDWHPNAVSNKETRRARKEQRANSVPKRAAKGAQHPGLRRTP